MSCKRWKRRSGGWSYNEWQRDDNDADNQNHRQQWSGAKWSGGGWSGPSGMFGGPNAWGQTAWAGPGFFGGRHFRILSGLRRDPWHGKIAGVCAGLGGYYGIRPKFIRIALIVGLFINPLLTIGGYALAAFLMPVLSETPQYGGRSEANAGTSARDKTTEQAAEEELPPELRFAALQDKFRDLETRTADMEATVTSPEFRLRRDFRKMREGEAPKPS
jgi:phage shock protein C